MIESKVINGKMYDTRTAKAMFRTEYDGGNGDPWYRETLYRKRTGEYFLYGESTDCFSRYCGGEIIPFTLDKAKQWAEENCDGDKYVEIFGEVEE